MRGDGNLQKKIKMISKTKFWWVYKWKFSRLPPKYRKNTEEIDKNLPPFKNWDQWREFDGNKYNPVHTSIIIPSDASHHLKIEIPQRLNNLTIINPWTIEKHPRKQVSPFNAKKNRLAAPLTYSEFKTSSVSSLLPGRMKKKRMKMKYILAITNSNGIGGCVAPCILASGLQKKSKCEKGGGQIDGRFVPVELIKLIESSAVVPNSPTWECPFCPRTNWFLGLQLFWSLGLGKSYFWHNANFNDLLKKDNSQ